ncbi:MAG TPA: NADH-quinone oxidoreductase subunit NuoH [Acidobacteriota bacterium]|nr:NADH-quinone oxidoreductase subunit NuoH [Acidobacteriota bacterium]
METILIYAVIPFIKIAVVVLVVLLAVAYLSWLERKLIGRIQVRLGPMRVGWHGLLQPIADGLKFVIKEDIIPAGADRLVFALAPIVSLIPALVVFSVIPFGPPNMLEGGLRWLLLFFLEPPSVNRVVESALVSGGFVTNVNIAVLFVMAVSSVGILGIILGGWASNSKYPLLGALRSTAQMISYEVALGFTILSVILVAQTMSLVDIVVKQQETGVWYVFLQPVAFVLFFVCGMAETNRLPFDLPEAESELVGGYHTEYSGFRFAIYFLAEYAAMITISSIAVTLFWGGWLRPFPNVQWLGVLDLVPPVIWFMAKVFVFLYIFIWVRGTLPRFRFDQLMRYGWKVFLPLAIANLIVTAGVMLKFS